MGFMDFVHGALDVAGFIPGVGAIADGINAGIYAAEGDWGNAALSLAAAVPGVGDAAAAVKIAGKVAKAAKTTKAAKVGKAAKSSKALSKLKDMCSLIKNIAGKAKTGAKKISDKISKLINFNKKKGANKGKCKGEGSCFTGDMLVYKENGLCPIKDIQKGDDIYSRDEMTGSTGLRKVAEVVRSEAHTIYHIWLGEKEEIKTTAYHPFYEKGKGWVNAINLREGVVLETKSGEVVITRIFKERFEEPVDVYNLQVEEWKSFFVSKMQVYVHNTPCGGKKWSGEKGTYSVAYEAKLPKDKYPGVSAAKHNQEANRQLHEQFVKDPKFAEGMEKLYPGITEGVKPGKRGAYPRKPPTKDVTWHHEPNREGVMQLMPIEQHVAPGKIQSVLHPNGKGGMQNWGGGRKRKK